MVQLSLLGSVVSNLLLVLGCACLLGGARHETQVRTSPRPPSRQPRVFNPHPDARQKRQNRAKIKQHFSTRSGSVTSASLLMAASSLALPAALKMSGQEDDLTDTVNLSRGSALVMLCMYGCYLLFSLKTNRWEFEGEGEKGKRRSWKKDDGDGGGPPPSDAAAGRKVVDDESLALISAPPLRHPPQQQMTTAPSSPSASPSCGSGS